MRHEGSYGQGTVIEYMQWRTGGGFGRLLPPPKKKQTNKKQKTFHAKKKKKKERKREKKKKRNRKGKRLKSEIISQSMRKLYFHFEKSK